MVLRICGRRHKGFSVPGDGIVQILHDTNILWTIEIQRMRLQYNANLQSFPVPMLCIISGERGCPELASDTTASGLARNQSCTFDHCSGR